MLSARRYRDQERAGALILRVWLEGSSEASSEASSEGSSDDPQLRIRMIGRLDLDRDTQDIGSASTVAEALAYVRDWLERFAASSR